MYETVLGGGRVHTASTRARASRTHARITPFGSAEAAHGAQVRLLPIRPVGRQRERVGGGWPEALRRRAAPVGREDAEELARRKFLRRVEDGIEPHPGPRGDGQAGDGGQGVGREEARGASPSRV